MTTLGLDISLLWSETAAQLQQFLVDVDLASHLSLAFGERADSSEARSLIEDLVSGTARPVVELVSTAEINGANGAFSSTTGKVYLAQEFIDSRGTNATVAVLLEELGHYLDWHLNVVDSPGDEGAIFANLVQGSSLDAPTLQTLQAENDHATVILDGQVIQIEQALTDFDLTFALSALADQDAHDSFNYENVSTLVPEGEYRARFKNIELPDGSANPSYQFLPGTPNGGLDDPGSTITPLDSTVKGLLVHTANAPWTSNSLVNTANRTSANAFVETLRRQVSISPTRLLAEDTYTGTSFNVGLLRGFGFGDIRVTLDWIGSNNLDLWLTDKVGGDPLYTATFTGTDTTQTRDNIEQFDSKLLSKPLPRGEYYVYVGSLEGESFTQDFSLFFSAQRALSYGKSSGDPHLKTLDGRRYDLQTMGDFIWTRSLIDDFQVQIRQEHRGRSRRVSWNTALATTIDGARVVYDTTLAPGQELSINGTNVTDLVPDGGILSVGNSQIGREGKRYTLTYAGPDLILGTVDDDVVSFGDRGRSLNVYIDPADYRSTLLEGLLGNGNGDRNDDFRLRDGTDLGPKPSWAELHTTFADAWRVTAAESLFSPPDTGTNLIISPGDADRDNLIQTRLAEDTVTQLSNPPEGISLGTLTQKDTVTQPSTPPEEISLGTLTQEDPAAVAAAFEQARALGIPEGEFLEDAVFDFLVTGDARVLEDTKDFAEFVLAREGGGTIQLGTLNGNLWNDLNGNGVQDGGETPLPGWTLYLDSVENGQLDQGELFTTTDANGAYSFTDLGAGTFVVGQVLQAGWEQTSPGASTSQTVDVASGATVENVNFGNVQPNVMEGTSRRNTLIGTEGRDIITGLRGRDTLTTGGGNDDLVYTALADAGDRITDFEVGRDRIVVSPLLESLNYQGTNAIADQYIQFQARGSDTLVQIDPDGLGSARARALVLVEDVTVAALNDTGNFVF